MSTNYDPHAFAEGDSVDVTLDRPDIEAGEALRGLTFTHLRFPLVWSMVVRIPPTYEPLLGFLKLECSGAAARVDYGTVHCTFALLHDDRWLLYAMRDDEDPQPRPAPNVRVSIRKDGLRRR